MQVVQLLRHHFVAADGLGMHALLPHLMIARFFVCCTIISQLIEQPFAPFGFELFDQSLRRESFQSAKGAGEIGTGKNGVEMVIQNDPSVDLQGLMFAAMEQGLDDDIATGARFKDGQPFDNGRCDKIGAMRFINDVATAHG